MRRFRTVGIELEGERGSTTVSRRPAMVAGERVVMLRAEFHRRERPFTKGEVWGGIASEKNIRDLARWLKGWLEGVQRGDVRAYLRAIRVVL